MSSRNLGQENSTLIHQINASLCPTSTVEIIPLTFGAGSDEGWTRFTLDAVNDWCGANFYCHNNVDTSADITITFLCVCTSADSSVVCKRYTGAWKTDGSENWSHNNIENGVAWNLDSSTADRIITATATFTAANIDDEDGITLALLLNEASRTIYVYLAYVTYTRV